MGCWNICWVPPYIELAIASCAGNVLSAHLNPMCSCSLLPLIIRIPPRSANTTTTPMMMKIIVDESLEPDELSPDPD